MAIRIRKEACRAHRRGKKLHEQQPEVVGENEMKDLWERYHQEKKKMAKDLVRKKRREEKEKPSSRNA